MTTISDDYMKEMMSRAKNYTMVILKHGPNYRAPGVEKIIWEHGRRNFSLREEGTMPIVCPVTDDSELAGVGIFNATFNEVKEIIKNDPGVKEGVFIYEIHTCKSFAGDKLLD